MKYFGYLLVVLGAVLAIALFVTNSGMPESEIVESYWYVPVGCFLLIGVGGFLSIKGK